MPLGKPYSHQEMESLIDAYNTHGPKRTVFVPKLVKEGILNCSCTPGKCANKICPMVTKEDPRITFTRKASRTSFSEDQIKLLLVEVEAQLAVTNCP